MLPSSYFLDTDISFLRVFPHFQSSLLEKNTIVNSQNKAQNSMRSHFVTKQRKVKKNRKEIQNSRNVHECT